jgi:hypothetical protein
MFSQPFVGEALAKLLLGEAGKSTERSERLRARLDTPVLLPHERIELENQTPPFGTR